MKRQLYLRGDATSNLNNISSYGFLKTTIQLKNINMKILNDNFLSVLNKEGVVTIVSMGESEPHIANTWNSFIHLTNDERLLIPAAGMQSTEKNIKTSYLMI